MNFSTGFDAGIKHREATARGILTLQGNLQDYARELRQQQVSTMMTIHIGSSMYHVNTEEELLALCRWYALCQLVKR